MQMAKCIELDAKGYIYTADHSQCCKATIVYILKYKLNKMID